LAGTAREWPATVAAALVFAACGLLLLVTHLPSRFRTLNETFMAAAVLIPYLQARRPLPARLAAGASLAVLAVIVVGHRTASVTDLAEALAVFVLAPIGFDVVDRGILDERAATSPTRRYGWYAALIALPLLFSFLQYGLHLHGDLRIATRYSVRTYEAFVAMLLVELYFAVGLGRVGGDPARAGGDGSEFAGHARPGAPGDSSGTSVGAPPG
jgi:hypothetical protein